MSKFDHTNPNWDMVQSSQSAWLLPASVAYVFEGRAAFIAGLSVCECPYEEDSVAYKYWMKGWREDYFDHMDAFGANLI